MSSFKDECGVFGIFGHPEAAAVTYLGLYALQHRGQEAAGIATSGRGSGFRTRKARGYVADVFDADSLEKLGGPNAIGHTRYSTAGDNTDDNIQPLHIECKFGEIAVCHNGNLVNAHLLRHELVEGGSIFRTTSDTEVVLHLYARSTQKDRIDAIFDAIRRIEGAFSLLFLTEDALFGVRDPRGFRPLIVGKLGETYVLCSESCALDLIDAEYVREVEPGEMVVIDKNGLRSMRPSPRRLTHSASSSTCTSPGRTAGFLEGTCIRRASPSDASSPARPRRTPTLWFPCPTRAPSPPSATRKSRGFPSSSDSSATTTWGGPSSSRDSPSGTSA